MWVWRKFYSTVVTKQDWRGKNPEHWQYCIKKSFTVKTIFTSEPKSQSMETTEYSYNIAPFPTNFNLKGIILFICCKAMWSSNRLVQNNAFINSSCTISQNYSTILLVSVGKVYCGKFRTYSSSITVMDHEAGIRCCTVWKNPFTHVANPTIYPFIPDGKQSSLCVEISPFIINLCDSSPILIWAFTNPARCPSLTINPF